MKLEIAKKKIDNQLVNAIYSKSDLNRFHPIRVVQAIKSLVGIDIENPNQKLLLWSENYLSKEYFFKDNHFAYKIDKPSGTIVISNLGKYILTKDMRASEKELQDLYLVSDGSQIFEYLLEFASMNSIQSIPFIWSAYRVGMFLENKHYYSLLFLSIKVLIKDIDRETGILSKFENICIFESIRNNPLTRKKRINESLHSILFESDFFQQRIYKDPIDVVEKGRIAILHYINDLDSKYITPELILFLDACRMVLKDSTPFNHLKVENSLNYIIKEALYAQKNW